MRLIDADALMQDIKSNAYIIRDVFNSTDEGMSINGIRYAIDNAPTASAPVTPTEQQEHGRLIDADALLKPIEESWKHAGLHAEDYKKIKKWIKNAPAIVSPVTSIVSEDCISREQVRAKLDCISYAEKDPITIAKRIVDNAPSVTPPKKVVAQISVDIEELIERIKEEYKITDKVGEWVRRYCFQQWKCSECEYEIDGKTNYCPNCGAKMGRKNGEA